MTGPRVVLSVPEPSTSPSGVHVLRLGTYVSDDDGSLPKGWTAKGAGADGILLRTDGAMVLNATGGGGAASGVLEVGGNLSVLVDKGNLTLEAKALANIYAKALNLYAGTGALPGDPGTGGVTITADTEITVTAKTSAGSGEVYVDGGDIANRCHHQYYTTHDGGSATIEGSVNSVLVLGWSSGFFIPATIAIVPIEISISPVAPIISGSETAWNAANELEIIAYETEGVGYIGSLKAIFDLTVDAYAGNNVLEEDKTINEIIDDGVTAVQTNLTFAQIMMTARTGLRNRVQY